MPVTGSHPAVQFHLIRGKLEPGGPHPLEYPVAISLKAVAPYSYIRGLINPRGPLPARRRASLSKAIIPASIGADAEVPDPPP